MADIAEMRLFKAVLIQAARDAYIKQHKSNMASALHFFRGGRDLQDVCDMSGADYERVLCIANNTDMTSNEKYILIKELVERTK